MSGIVGVTVQHPKADSLAQVSQTDPGLPGQTGNGAGVLGHAAAGALGQAEAPGGDVQQPALPIFEAERAPPPITEDNVPLIADAPDRADVIVFDGDAIRIPE